MITSQQKVAEFMKIAGQTVFDSPTLPNSEVRVLRVKLLLEEVLELAAASGVEIFAEGVSLHRAFEGKTVSYGLDGACDLVGVADGLADIKYVNEGAANAFGINLNSVFDEVHRSNMTKRWNSADLGAIETSDTPGDISLRYNGEVVTLQSDQSLPIGSRRHVVKNASGKMIKSPSYEPANIKDVLFPPTDDTVIVG